MFTVDTHAEGTLEAGILARAHSIWAVLGILDFDLA